MEKVKPMDKWLHLHVTGTPQKPKYVVQRALSSRAIRTMKSYDFALMYADWFAFKYELVLFVHNITDSVISEIDHRSEITVPYPSNDFKTHYNATMANKLKVECPNIEKSDNIQEVTVRARFKDNEEPEFIVVHVKTKNGKVRFKETVYMFPNSELIAKIGLLT